MPNIMLAGGGTAGHIMPNLALVPLLSKKFEHIYYIGGDGMERQLAEKNGLQFFATDVVKFNRSHLLANAKIPFILNNAVKQAKKILIHTKTDMVFSKGGYCAIPVCLAAHSLKIPVVTHESDFSMGLANKLISTFATATITSFPETKHGTFIGTPIRDSVLNGNAAQAKKQFSLGNRPTILVFGGSLGAQAINAVVDKTYIELINTYNIIHIAGKNNSPIDLPFYKRLTFSDNIGDLMALADILVIRGGANSLAEATALGKRTLCIPLPKGASRGDQLDNALSYQKRGVISVLKQDELNEKTFVTAVASLAASPPPKTNKNSAVNAQIVDFICQFL